MNDQILDMTLFHYIMAVGLYLIALVYNAYDHHGDMGF